MKTHGIKYEFLGEPRTFETDSLFEFGQKLEEIICDPNILENSISFYTKEP